MEDKKIITVVIENGICEGVLTTMEQPSVVRILYIDRDADDYDEAMKKRETLYQSNCKNILE